MAADAPQDVSSLVTQVSSLATEKKLLEEKLKEHAAIVERFQEQERAEMKKKFDTIIQQWVNENDWTDPKLKESVLEGMQDLVQKNKKDSPIWNMVCCASETHQRNVTKLNQITEEYNRLKSQVEGGTFRGEEARLNKRKEPEPPTESVKTIWDDFDSKSLSHFTPDPDVVKNLRQEWRPL